MSLSAQSSLRRGLVRRGITLEVFTLSWMTVEAAVAVAAGIAAGSVALMAFGIDSGIEFVAVLVVLQTFRAEQAGRTDRSEEALRVIGLSFFLLAVYIIADAAYTLIAANKPESSVYSRVCRRPRRHAFAGALDATYRERPWKPDAAG
jgi:divalent metal cation (Fe/Co/Zn/Cd) transporter